MSAQSELCPAPPPTLDLPAARSALMTRLYELRYQTADLAVGLSRCHDLSAALKAQLAHGEIYAAIELMEKAHPELI